MIRYMSSGLILMMAYIVLVILGAPIAWGAGRLIEVSYPQNVALSTFVFMGVLTLVLLVAGPIAFRLTPDDPASSDLAVPRAAE